MMIIKSILIGILLIIFSPFLLVDLPKHKIQLSEFLQSEVEQIEIEPVIEFSYVPQSLIKGEDMTMFYFRHIRPNLPDYNPIKTKERKK
jgi:hypothetical protein